MFKTIFSPSSRRLGLIPKNAIGKFFRYSSNRGTTDTIYSLSSGHGRCGVAVIRVSGDKTVTAIEKMTDRQLPRPNRAVLRRLRDPVTKEPIDRCLLLWFQGPRSFTGEDVCEMQVHGGPAVVSAVYAALEKVKGLRHAEAGEFTKRSFLNGKLDLTEVEGLADLIHAETEAQRKQALRQMEGALSQLYHRWKDALLKCVANVEAYIDFSEDDNIEEGVLDQVEMGVRDLLKEVKQHLEDNRRGERLRNGVQVVIAGAPNEGKSSLLNILCQRPAAIVSPIAGTTRDVVESALNLGGYPIVVSDTAGLRKSGDQVEREGVHRALQRICQSDVIILVKNAMEVNQALLSSVRPDKMVLAYLEDLLKENMTEDDIVIRELENIHDLVKRTLLVINKVDLLENREQFMERLKQANGAELFVGLCVTSCKNGFGIDSFLDFLKDEVQKICGNPMVGNPSLTQQRHRSHLTSCVEALRGYLTDRDQDRGDLVISAEYLRSALRELSQITGKISTEDILDVVFRDFCIGK